MNSQLLLRLFRAIAEQSMADIVKIGELVIIEQRKRGHSSLAEKLQNLLSTPSCKDASNFTPDSHKDLLKLPTSKRYKDPLVSIVPRDKLKHYMVLSETIESKFKRIEQEFHARERLAKYGLKYKKKILLYGMPGCGKSLGAERLAWNTGLPLIKVRLDAIISSYFGESASNLRNIFESTKEYPCLLFLDECDFLAKSRDIANDVGEIPRIVNILLQLLEDFDSPGLLVAATNLEKSLDMALFRRFDDAFEVPPPESEQIYEIISMALSSFSFGYSVYWENLISRMKGFSAANVVQVAQEAAKRVVLEGRASIELEDIEQAINEVLPRRMGAK